MSLQKTMLASIAFASLAGAAAAEEAVCPEPTRLRVHQLVGEWRTKVATDEGWRGEGKSVFEVDEARGCALVERSTFTLDTGEGDPVVSESLAVYAWDELSSAWKLISTDSRGYTHVGLGVEAGAREWAFEVQRGDVAPNRRILFRPRDGGAGFEWVWQGREDDTNSAWHDRLVSTYTRLESRDDKTEL